MFHKDFRVFAKYSIFPPKIIHTFHNVHIYPDYPVSVFFRENYYFHLIFVMI